MTRGIADLAGWIGAFALLLAYAAVSFKRLRPDSRPYQLLNAVGSLLLIMNTVYYHAFPSAFVNVVWIAIAVISWVRASTRARREARSGALPAD
ncbi:MAG TPA: hypothetical protein VMT28_16035 [Terriglobales bacterium]|nr:hypothetical protein [Terriglobales bacterium]